MTLLMLINLPAPITQIQCIILLLLLCHIVLCHFIHINVYTDNSPSDIVSEYCWRFLTGSCSVFSWTMANKLMNHINFKDHNERVGSRPRIWDLRWGSGLFVRTTIRAFGPPKSIYIYIWCALASFDFCRKIFQAKSVQTYCHISNFNLLQNSTRLSYQF